MTTITLRVNALIARGRAAVGADASGNRVPSGDSLSQHGLNEFWAVPDAEACQEFQYDWVRQHLDGSRDPVLKNTYLYIGCILTECAGHSPRPECECYDIGHL